ncbi:MAG: hypothetical protein M3081_21605 [Gemmatimonadota bacterium]|nr:hypothetical protein [Gemmatimonadota bacterium]
MSARLLMVALACATVTAAPTATKAQAAIVDSALRAGDRVRAVRIRGRDVTGALVSIGDRGIVIDTRFGQLDTLPASNVGELWRSRGAGRCVDKRPACVIGGAMLGAAIGVGIGKGLGSLAERNVSCRDDDLCGLTSVAAMVAGGIFGGIAGTGVGATIGGEQWERIPSPVPRVGLTLAPRGSVTVAWSGRF